MIPAANITTTGTENTIAADAANDSIYTSLDISAFSTALHLHGQLHLYIDIFVKYLYLFIHSGISFETPQIGYTWLGGEFSRNRT